MKKVVLITMFLLLTGCMNGNRDFETICNKKEESQGFIYNKSYKIYSNSDNEITKIIEIHKLEYTNDLGKSSFDASKLSLNSYAKTKDFEMKIIKDLDNIYEVNFVMEIDKLNDDELEKISIKRNYQNQLKEYKKDMKCD